MNQEPTQTVMHLDDDVGDAQAAPVLHPKLKKAQQIYAMLGNGFVTDMRQVEIMNSKRVRPVVEQTEDEKAAAKAKADAHALEIFYWNKAVEDKKETRAARRSALPVDPARRLKKGVRNTLRKKYA